MKTVKSKLSDATLKKFLALSSALSPENLHCDGEISRAAARKKEKRLLKEWADLENEVGRKVEEYEVLIEDLERRGGF